MSAIATVIAIALDLAIDLAILYHPIRMYGLAQMKKIGAKKKI